MTTDTFAILALATIATSLTNPRKTFNPVKLSELAESIKASGVHQPILVRPLPGSRVADTSRGTTHEIVAGERRYRASQLAGLATIPALVRDLDDHQVLEIQLVENLQRDDLTELEEAEGYDTLMQASQLTAEAVGSKIGKSRSYVYGRLKLLDLCQETRAALRTGTIDASRALLIARIPDTKLQIKATKDILEGNGYSYGQTAEPMSVRQAKAHIQDRYMVRLDTAKFDITCTALLPDAGSCKTCAKRTGHDPDLFADVKGADVCTDPPCFHAKAASHADTLVQSALAKGQTVIAGKEALELMPQAGYNAKFKGYRRLDDPTDSPTDKPLRKIIGKQMETDGITPVMIANPHKSGELVAALPNEVVARLLKAVEGQAAAAKTVAKEVREFADKKASKAAEKEHTQFEQAWRTQLLEATWEMMESNDEPVATPPLLRYLARKAAHALSTDQAEALCELLQLGKVAPYQAVADWVKTTPNPDYALALLTMHRDSSADDHAYQGHVPNEGLMLVASDVLGDGLAETIASIKADLKTQIIEAKTRKSPKPLLPLPSAAQAGGVRGPKGPKTKTTAAQAQAQIAAALQAQDTNPGATAQSDVADSIQPADTPSAFAPGLSQSVGMAVDMRVRITTEHEHLPLTQYKFCGKEGTITQAMDDNRYMVTFKGRNGGMCAFDAADLTEVVA